MKIIVTIFIIHYLWFVFIQNRETTIKEIKKKCRKKTALYFVFSFFISPIFLLALLLGFIICLLGYIGSVLDYFSSYFYTAVEINIFYKACNKLAYFFGKHFYRKIGE